DPTLAHGPGDPRGRATGDADPEPRDPAPVRSPRPAREVDVPDLALRLADRCGYLSDALSATGLDGRNLGAGPVKVSDRTGPPKGEGRVVAMNLVRRTPLLLALLLMPAGPATACPNCKEAVAAQPSEVAGMARGYNWSVLFMLAVPFTLLS